MEEGDAVLSRKRMRRFLEDVEEEGGRWGWTSLHDRVVL
jgi:hypothetical protein